MPPPLNLELIEYKGQNGKESLVIRGVDGHRDATRQYTQQFKKDGLGGLFCAGLTHQDERFAGWVFPLNKRQAVEKWLETGNLEDAKALLPTRPTNVSGVTREQYESLLARVVQLEKAVFEDEEVVEEDDMSGVSTERLRK